MIDFVKFPAGDERPFINLNGHEWSDCANFISRVASLLDANAIMFHSVRVDISGTPQLEAIPSKVVPLNEARLMKNGIVVANIKGLPVSADLQKRAKGEDVVLDPNPAATKKQLQEEISALKEQVTALEKTLDAM